jgi:hypothetical protein
MKATGHLDLERAVRRPVHARHGHARDLQVGRRQVAAPRRTCASRARATARKAIEIATGAPVDIGGHREDVEVEEERRRPRRHHRDYGADTARWFMLSDSPPERDDAGVRGAWGSIQKLWALVEAAPASDDGPADSGEPLDLRRLAHRTVRDVTSRHREIPLQRRHRPHERAGQRPAQGRAVHHTRHGNRPPRGAETVRPGRSALRAAPRRRMHGPRIGGHRHHHDREMAKTPDPALLVSDTVTLPVQINGKKRAEITVSAGCRRRQRSKPLAREDEAVIPHLDGPHRAKGDCGPRPYRQYRGVMSRAALFKIGACNGRPACRLRLHAGLWRRTRRSVRQTSGPISIRDPRARRLKFRLRPHRALSASMNSPARSATACPASSPANLDISLEPGRRAARLRARPGRLAIRLYRRAQTWTLKAAERNRPRRPGRCSERASGSTSPTPPTPTWPPRRPRRNASPGLLARSPSARTMHHRRRPRSEPREAGSHDASPGDNDTVKQAGPRPWPSARSRRAQATHRAHLRR